MRTRYLAWCWSPSVLSVLLAACTTIPVHSEPPVYSDTPPAKLRLALADAARPLESQRKAALELLATEGDWEPYFRSAFNAITDQRQRELLRPALLKCQSTLFAWNMERSKEWAKDLRLDYLISLAVATDDAKPAGIIGQYFVTAQKDIHDRFKAMVDWGTDPPSKMRSFMNMTEFAQFTRAPFYSRLSGDRVTIEDGASCSYIHCRGGEIHVRGASRWLCLSEKQLTEIDRRSHVGWNGSVLGINSDACLQNLHESLVICDGDLELISPFGSGGSCTKSVVICNGTVDSTNLFEVNGPSVIYATGDFTGPAEASERPWSIITGGKNAAKVDPSKAEAWVKRFPEGVKENPFGVKFVSPADVGVELTIGAKVVRLGTMKESSPLVKAGLEKEDRVLKLNGVTVETAADFRRQLRESLLWGTGLLEIKRGDQTFLRLVKFAEPPKK